MSAECGHGAGMRLPFGSTALQATQRPPRALVMDNSRQRMASTWRAVVLVMSTRASSKLA